MSPPASHGSRADASDRQGRPGACSPLAPRALALCLALATPGLAQHWRDLQGRSKGGVVELHQAVRDAGSDALALLIASHPDDRYVLPAALLRHRHGLRVVVLLATRGGGGQNSRGPETGDALERIRTLETEAGCWLLGAEVCYLNRPDGGYRRTAAEAFGEWGREGTIRDLVRLIRTVRPDLVLTTHHHEENHGHDLALVEILPEAVRLAAVDDYQAGGLPAHRSRRLFMGAPATPPPGSIRVSFDEIDPVRGVTFRRLAYDVIARTHVSASPMLPMDLNYEPEMWFVPQDLGGGGSVPDLVSGLPSMFDGELWPAGLTAELRDLARALGTELATRISSPTELVDTALGLIDRLRALPVQAGSELERRRDLRLEALERVVRVACGIQVEVETNPADVGVPGEELDLLVRIHNGPVRDIDGIAVEAIGSGPVRLEPVAGESGPGVPMRKTLRAQLTFSVPLTARAGQDPMEGAFRGDKFTPPVRLLFLIDVAGRTIPTRIDVPIDLRPPVEVDVLPRMLLLPSQRQFVQFTVALQRNSRFPVDYDLDVLTPAGYVITGPAAKGELREERVASFDFTVRAPHNRKGGVDVLRIRVGNQRISLPVHKIDVTVDSARKVGLVRGNDDALLSVIGIGGFGLDWSELSDTDLAVRDLSEFDVVVVDIRALRDRPRARRNYRRLLEFAGRRGKRLVVFYHKDTEFDPPGEGFVGAPFLPFQIGRARVTRPDAPVRILAPEHVLLNSPNQIRPSDWDAWEQERGLYFPSVYADQYQELLEMNDPGFPPERSSLLYAPVGEGEFVYCALALYRQLKKLHPGGVRLLANLLTPGRDPR